MIIDTNPHAAEKALMRRIVLRHVADPSAQLLLLQKGDVDIARDLGSDQLKSIAGDKNLTHRVVATGHLDVHRDEPGDAGAAEGAGAPGDQVGDRLRRDRQEHHAEHLERLPDIPARRRCPVR